ncbi:hypothetical protein [Clostridium fallax]|uniref:Comf operon protein A, DNA transporter ATPase n=1 Tax=Clostridium fallax TaxID=1533 RepID=A0A1M4VE25_9CLOT|nr:hypothetical protein [Clostridium fallax]SHE67148.1 hypothetical protein SAMN05443638_10789 [Clostridium fallax]SQB05762.1 comf operon protein A, DNA transporter ATPase [Clostridium fallax]
MSNLKIDRRCVEINYIIRKIENWYEKDIDKVLNIITIPYNTSLIFRTLVKKVYNEGGSILYVINGNTVDETIIKSIKTINNIEDYNYFTRSKDEKNGKLKFVTSDLVYKYKDFYDLVIYDDISAFSHKEKIEIRMLLDYLYKKCEKLLIYSVEKIFNNCKCIDMCGCINNTPFPEPRIITTRIDLTKDIPYLVYDYLKWFSQNKRTVVIHTPTKESVDRIYDYFCKVLNMSSNIRILKIKSKKDYKIFKKISELKDKPLMIITNYIGDYLKPSELVDIIIYFSEDKYYNYKKLLYLCGKVILSKDGYGEVLFVSNSITKDMEKAKEIARDFNKRLWEKGILDC